jgi:predicted metal-dependent enzyme (double-stranded beta helix superfamily)
MESPIHFDATELVVAAGAGGPPADVAAAVAEHLCAHPVRLRTETVHGSQLLYAAPHLSVHLLLWAPGRTTRIHDHVAWCVVAILGGSLHEHIYRVRGDHVAPDGRLERTSGSVRGCAPPDDIHSVRNPGPGTAVSLHVYGADLRRGHRSVRRIYSLPVAA